jgi:hypothetical protein
VGDANGVVLTVYTFKMDSGFCLRHIAIIQTLAAV